MRQHGSSSRSQSRSKPVLKGGLCPADLVQSCHQRQCLWPIASILPPTLHVGLWMYSLYELQSTALCACVLLCAKSMKGWLL